MLHDAGGGVGSSEGTKNGEIADRSAGFKLVSKRASNACIYRSHASRDQDGFQSAVEVSHGRWPGGGELKQRLPEQATRRGFHGLA